MFATVPATGAPPTPSNALSVVFPATATVPVKLAVLEIVCPFIKPEVIAPEEIVPMFNKFPLTSILFVPAPAPVLIPVVPFMVVPVIVFPVVIVPKPEAIVPATNAPVVLI